MSKTCVILALGFPSIVVALIETKYGIHNPKGGKDFAACGQLLQDTNACAGRFTNTTCEPLTFDWCLTKDMSDGATYMTKKYVVDKLEDTLITDYFRDVPISINEGTHVEVKFMLHAGWKRAYITLRDELTNLHLRTTIRETELTWLTRINGTLTNKDSYPRTTYFEVEKEYTFRFVCRNDDFQIYVNGDLYWTYNHQLPPQDITILRVWFPDVPGDLFYVSYKNGL